MIYFIAEINDIGKLSQPGVTSNETTKNVITFFENKYTHASKICQSYILNGLCIPNEGSILELNITENGQRCPCALRWVLGLDS